MHAWRLPSCCGAQGSARRRDHNSAAANGAVIPHPEPRQHSRAAAPLRLGRSPCAGAEEVAARVEPKCRRARTANPQAEWARKARGGCRFRQQALEPVHRMPPRRHLQLRRSADTMKQRVLHRCAPSFCNPLVHCVAMRQEEVCRAVRNERQNVWGNKQQHRRKHHRILQRDCFRKPQPADECCHNSKQRNPVPFVWAQQRRRVIKRCTHPHPH